MDSDIYLTIRSVSGGLYKEKGSRFIAMAFPVGNQDEIKSILEKTRKEHHSARHHCYAWMLGKDRLIFRSNDDGEPSGTAGKPILGQIESYGLTNVLIVVVRYFGGKLLGAGGLINAYKSAAESAIKNSEIIEKVVMDFYELKFPYSSLNAVMKLIKDEGLGQSSQIFGEECIIKISFRKSAHNKIIQNLTRIDRLKFTPSGTF